MRAIKRSSLCLSVTACTAYDINVSASGRSMPATPTAASIVSATTQAKKGQEVLACLAAKWAIRLASGLLTNPTR
jgi:hypothetical protein